MSRVSSIFAEFEARVLDIGQAVIHEDLALGILVSVERKSVADFQAAVTKAVQDADALIRVSPVSQDNYKEWLEASGQPRFILTLLSAGDGSAPLREVSRLTHQHGLNIDTIRRLTDRGDAVTGMRDEKLCIEMRLRGAPGALGDLQGELMGASDELGFDFSLQEDTVFRRTRRLVAFDMDSTLITAEVIDELAARHGVGDKVAEITAAAMAGQIDFKESFRRRAALLKGMPESVLNEITTSVELNTGAHRLLRALSHFGYRTAVISGGFQRVGLHLQAQLGIDHVHANTLVARDGVMTGEVEGEIVDAERKALLLKSIAEQEGISLQQTIAIGDGANDLPMLRSAGLGVAFHAKQVVRESAHHAISNFGLDAVLYLIGFSDRDIAQALDG